MCGIAGIIELVQGRHIEVPALDRMIQSMTHRGPDDDGRFVHGSVGLGMSRLSIIDVEGGHQPIKNEDGTVTVVANGELFSFPELRAELLSAGHRFATRSDVEVLVHGYEEWGIEGLLRRLNGMFAFALYDEDKRTTFLARDRMGIKPLVYTSTGQTFFFASGLTGLLASGHVVAEPDPVGVRLFLHNQFVPAPYTVLRNVKKIPPASYLVIDDRGVGEPIEYWQPPLGEEKNTDAEEWQQRLRSSIEDAVRVHMLSDVEVGAFLSGGIDSSVVVGLMARHTGAPIKAFSIGVEGDDETPFARAAAARFGVDFHHLEFGPRHLRDVIDRTVGVMEEPIADPAVLPTLLLASEAHQHVKVVLTGEGGDELFAGYGYYERFRSGWQRAKAVARRAVAMTGGVGVGYRHRSYWSGYPYVMTPAAVETFLSDLPGGDQRGTERLIDSTERAAADRGSDALDRALRVDARLWLPDNLLMKVDRATMAFSVEARVPLLDYRVVELAARIPAEFKIRGGLGKWVFRSAFRDLIGEELANRPKMGFGVPIGEWFRGELEPLLVESLDEESLSHTPWIDATAVNSIMQGHRSRAGEYARPLWTLYVLARWFREVGNGQQSKSAASALS